MLTGTSLERFTLRPASLNDVEAVVDLSNASARKITNTEEYDVAETRARWQYAHFSPARDGRIAVTPQGKPVGAAEVWDSGWPHSHMWLWMEVHPDYRRYDIGKRLIDWGVTHARAEALEWAADDTRIVIEGGANSHDEWLKKVYEDYGFSLVRHFYRMEIDLVESLPTPDWPVGITIRTIENERDERRAFAAIIDSFKDHWGFVPGDFEEEFAQFQQELNTFPGALRELFIMALDGDEVAGVAINQPSLHGDQTAGHVAILGVRRPWRRRGLGLALLLHSFKALHQLGKQRVKLGVDADSLTGATRLYERAGMHVEQRFDAYSYELRAGIDPSTQLLNENQEPVTA